MLHQLAPKYIDTGKAKVVYHHMAFIGNESQWAAEAAECAGAQNKFWAYADYVFTHQAGENVGAFSRNNLKGFAGQVGLDMNAFNACFDSGKYTQVVQQETQQGQQLGIRGTPTFFLNGQRITNLPTADEFGRMIDSLE